MKILLFGATGMVGQGVLRECLLDTGVDFVQTVGRAATGVHHPKLREIAHQDLWNCRLIESQMKGFDGCLFCLGVSSAGLDEKAYTHLTYDLTLAVAETLSRLNPEMTFVYVSGTGTDSTEKGRTMWARVKGRTENALLRLPFKRAYMLRPGFIQPLHGARSKTNWYRWLYAASAPVYPLLKRVFPQIVTTTEEIARVMLILVKKGSPKSILESADITSLARTS